MFFSLLQLDILCTSAVKDTVIKTTIYRTRVTFFIFFCALEFIKARKTCYRVVRTSIWSIQFSGALCNKNCIVKTFDTLIV